MTTEVRKDIQFYREQLLHFKKLYWALQCELDRVDSLRKNWDYYIVKQEVEKLGSQKAMENKTFILSKPLPRKKLSQREIQERDLYRAPECIRSFINEGVIDAEDYPNLVKPAGVSATEASAAEPSECSCDCDETD